MKLKLILATSCLLSSLFAQANQNSGIQSISFEDFKSACENPAMFHNQIAPTNIQISCRDVQLKWIPDAGNAQYLQTAHQITTSIISDKYASDAKTGCIKSEPQMISCPSYKQVSETVETVRAISCADILAFKGNATDFCLTTINSLKKANPEAAMVQATGQTINLCNADYNQQGPRR